MLSFLLSVLATVSSPHQPPEPVMAAITPAPMSAPADLPPVDAYISSPWGGRRVRARRWNGGRDPKRTFFGHPEGLRNFFGTELWERWSYYAMRTLLRGFLAGAVVMGGFEFDKTHAKMLVMTYQSLVYLMCIAGGWFADRFMGKWAATAWGAGLIMSGHLALLIHSPVPFFAGLILVILGTGLLKGNVSAMVGRMYRPEEKQRRDAGFTIFYMGINLGATVGPMVSSWFVPSDEAGSESYLQLQGWEPSSLWHAAFVTAAIGMLFGLLQFLFGRKKTAEYGPRPELSPDDRRSAVKTLMRVGVIVLIVGSVIALLLGTGVIATTPDNLYMIFGVVYIGLILGVFYWLYHQPWTDEEQGNIRLLTALFVGAAIFWAAFEQAASTLDEIAKEFTNRSLLMFDDFKSGWYQSVNPAYVLLLGPVFAWMWTKLGSRNPTYPAKFSFGLAGVTIGCFVMALGLSGATTGAISGGWLFLVYLIFTLGELCLSPIGLSAMTLLAPAKIAGFAYGVWFLGSSAGTFIGSLVVKFFSDPTDGLEKNPELLRSTLLHNDIRIMIALGVLALLATCGMAALIKPMRRFDQSETH